MQDAQSHEQQQAIRIPNFRAMMSLANPQDSSSNLRPPAHRPVVLPGIESLVKPGAESSSIRSKKTSSVAVPAILRNSSGPRSALVLPPLPALGPPPAAASAPHHPHQHQQQPFEPPEQCILCGGTMTSSRDRKYKSLQSLAKRIEESCIPTPFVYKNILSSASNERAEAAAAAACNVSAPSSIMSPCCIACFNWIKRLADPADPSLITFERKIIPLDNLIMFLNNPGGNCISSKVDIPMPDCRSVFRLMCHLSSETVVRPPATSSGRRHAPREYRLKNPYLMFFSPITERIVECFGAFYGSSEPVFVGQQHQQLQAETNPGGRREKDGEEAAPEEETDVNTEEAMYRIVYWWWESTGMPVVMPHKQCAQYVRKALRADSIRNLPDSLSPPPSAQQQQEVPPIDPA